MARSLRTALALIVIAGLTWACDNTTDSSSNFTELPKGLSVGGVADEGPADPGTVDPGPPVDTGGVDVPVASPCDCMKVGDWYRFTRLQITSVDKNPEHTIIELLNSLWSGDIARGELNIYFQVKRVEAGEIEFEAVTAARVRSPGDVCDTPDLTNSINAYAGDPTHPKNCAPDAEVTNAIPVSNAKLSTTIEPGCGVLHGKVLTAGLRQSALCEVCTCTTLGCGVQCDELDASYFKARNPNDKNLAVCTQTNMCTGCNSKYQPLMGLLNQLSVKPSDKLTFKCVSATGEPAVCITADFDAEKVDFVPLDCP